MTTDSTVFDFKKAFEELEGINAWFSRDSEIDLSQAVEKYRRGAELVKEIRTHLAEVENEFREIKEGLEN